jgi:hypothetical protein
MSTDRPDSLLNVTGRGTDPEFPHCYHKETALLAELPLPYDKHVLACLWPAWVDQSLRSKPRGIETSRVVVRYSTRVRRAGRPQFVCA